jgi:predicted nucleic-acid-binding protein
MKGLDANVLTRYLRDDDPGQSRRAAHFIQRAIRQNEPLYVNHVVLCELVWILDSVYEHPKSDIIRMLEAVMLTGQFQLEDKPSIEMALEDYRKTKADFADCLIGRRNRALGVDVTQTFDRRLKSVETFEVL